MKRLWDTECTRWNLNLTARAFQLGAFTGLASQLLFVVASLAAGGLFRTAIALCFRTCPNQRTGNRRDVIAAYAIGTVAVFWPAFADCVAGMSRTTSINLPELIS